VGTERTRIAPGDWGVLFCDPTVRTPRLARDDALRLNMCRKAGSPPGEGARRLQAFPPPGPLAEQMLMPLENAIRLDGTRSTDDPSALVCGWVRSLVPLCGLLAANLHGGETVLIIGCANTSHFGAPCRVVAPPWAPAASSLHRSQPTRRSRI